MAAIGDPGWLVYLRDGAGNLLESCSPATGPVSCEVGAPGEVGKPTAARTSIGGLATSGLAVGVTCTNPNGCTNSSDSSFHNAGAAIQGATITLQDPSAPLIGAGLAGALTDSQSVLTGVQTLAVSASDQGGGVGRIGLNAFGSNQVASLPVACDFTRPVPCPAATTQTIPLDTRTIPDGLVTLSVFVEDAAGNRSTSASWSVRVDNTPASISRFTTFPEAVRVGQSFELKWETAGEGFAPSTEARWRLVAPDGTTAREGTERASPTLGPRSIPGLVLGSPGLWRIEVTLIDQLGRAGPLATYSLAPRPAAGGSTRTGDPRVRLTKTRALVRVAPARRARRFGTRVLVARRVAGAWRRTVPARATTLSVPLPRPARRAARFRLEWRAPGKGWRALVVRPSA